MTTQNSKRVKVYGSRNKFIVPFPEQGDSNKEAFVVKEWYAKKLTPTSLVTMTKQNTDFVDGSYVRQSVGNASVSFTPVPNYFMATFNLEEKFKLYIYSTTVTNYDPSTASQDSLAEITFDGSSNITCKIKNDTTIYTMNVSEDLLQQNISFADNIIYINTLNLVTLPEAIVSVVLDIESDTVYFDNEPLSDQEYINTTAPIGAKDGDWYRITASGKFNNLTFQSGKVAVFYDSLKRIVLI